MSEEEANTLELQAAARLIDISPRRVQQLAKEGWLKATTRGRYPLVGLVQGYINYLRDESRRASKSAADSRLVDAKARQVEMAMEKEQGRLITMEEALATHDRMAGLFLESVSGMPARITKDPVERRKLEYLFAMERERLSSRFAEIGEELETGEKVGR